MSTSDDAAAHWVRVYTREDVERVSWYQRQPRRSLALIEFARLAHDAAIIDVGGGASSLAARLVDDGYTDVTVVDISSAALDHARAGAASAAAQISWVEADIRTHQFGRRYDLWHDRATFHFMATPHDREAYLDVLRHTLRVGGHLILVTFGPDGPEQCSGLPVVRYDAPGLSAVLGPGFTRSWSGFEAHRTPAGTIQQFLYAHFVRSA